MHAALRITWDALIFRLRRREMNNLPATVALMLAFSDLRPRAAIPDGSFSFDTLDVVFRTGFLLVLNVYAYLMNDYADIKLDLASLRKDASKVNFLAANRRAGLGALIGLGAMLAAAAVLHGYANGSPVLLIAFVANTVIILLYSTWLKRLPFLDVLMMVLWGASMPLTGVPETDLGFRLLGVLALMCSCYEVIQVVRDEADDRAAGLMTTAVRIGAGRAVWLFRALVAGTAIYGVSVVGSPVALALLAALLLPLTPARAERTWDLTRVLFALVWLAILGQIYFGYLGF